MEFFSELNKHLLMDNIKKSFMKKGFLLSEINVLEFRENHIEVSLVTKCGNKILVEKYHTNIHWKLNNMNMGEVIGNSICDVAGDYEYQMKK